MFHSSLSFKSMLRLHEPSFYVLNCDNDWLLIVICPDRRSKPNLTRTVSDRFARSWSIWRRRRRSVKSKAVSWRNRKPDRSTWSLRWTHTSTNTHTHTLQLVNRVWLSQTFWLGSDHQAKSSLAVSENPLRYIRHAATRQTVKRRRGPVGLWGTIV